MLNLLSLGFSICKMISLNQIISKASCNLKICFPGMLYYLNTACNRLAISNELAAKTEHKVESILAEILKMTVTF